MLSKRTAAASEYNASPAYKPSAERDEPGPGRSADIVSFYLDETGARPHAATLAVAGPIDGEEVALTNRAWRFRRGEFARHFGLSQLRVVNDFEAIAWALPRLGAAETRPLGKPATPREGVKLVLGPGTGLGVAALLPAGGRWHVWVEGTTVGQRTSVLPFFKSLGSAAPGSFGVLEVERVDPGGTRAERWVMVRGSVSRSEDSWDRIST